MQESASMTYQRIRGLARSHRQLVAYGLIGLSGATLDFLGYLVLYKYFGVAPPLASFISVTLGITNNFILNSRFNFKVSDNLWARFASDRSGHRSGRRRGL